MLLCRSTCIAGSNTVKDAVHDLRQIITTCNQNRFPLAAPEGHPPASFPHRKNNKRWIDFLARSWNELEFLSETDLWRTLTQLSIALAP